MTAQAASADTMVDAAHVVDAVRVLETARDAFVAVDEAGLITDWNRAAAALFGWSREEVLGRRVSELIIPEPHRAAHDAGFRRLLETGEPRAIGGTHEYEAMRRSGETFPVEVTHWCGQGRYACYAFIRDVTAQRESEAELARYRARAAELTHRTLHDDLTGLPNRSLAIDRLTQALLDREHRQRALAVLFVDLDRFKLVNDSLGHQAGDQLLCEMASRLCSAVRPGDTVARVAGDEFVVVCDDLSVGTEVEEIAHRIRAALDVPVPLAGQQVHVGASIGIAVARPANETAEDLFREADAAMYRAKERGGGRIAVFDEDMRERLRNRLQIERELVGCAERGELRLRYRPIADVRTRQVAGVQTLTYWEHPRYGLLEPEQFLDVADATGSVVPISTWALTESFRQVRQWREYGASGLFMMANFSYRDITQSYFIDAVGDMLRDSGLDPAAMMVGITSPELGAHPGSDSVIKMMRTLAGTGVRIQLNRFGGGQSAIPLLSSLTPDSVRIDGSLLPGIDRDERIHYLVRHLVELARGIGAHVMVDGVETPDQWHSVAELGCDYAQGPYVGRAFPPEEAPAWLAVG